MASYIIGTLDLTKFDLASSIAYLNGISKQAEEYDEFAQGYWKNISLFNSTGRADDTQYRNTRTCVPTEHVEHCQGLAHMIMACFKLDNLTMVRARNLIDGMVIPHRDFVELDPRLRYLRVFLPLETNDRAFHSDASGVFQMRVGELWYLDAASDHAAINFSSGRRLFLCLDFAFASSFDDTDIIAPTAPFTRGGAPHYVHRSVIAETEKRGIVDALACLLSRETFKDLVFAVSKIRFTRDAGVAECYDWVVEAARRSSDPILLDKALKLRRYLVEERALGERFSFDDWR